MSTRPGYDFRIGIDLGGTKTEVAALAPDGRLRHRHRVPTPEGYDAALRGMAGMIGELEQKMGGTGSVGFGIPGVISPATGLVKNANTIALNGHPFDRDIAALLGREVRVENDANCFALSEAVDGAGAGQGVVFGVILGTGCGGGIVVDGRVMRGRNRVTGEWGHTPLPWPKPEELPGIKCWCGHYNCMETWVSGTGLARDCDGPDARDGNAVAERALAGEAKALAALGRHAERLARGLAVVVNILDPDVIVLGGGVSNMAHLYEQVPGLMVPHVFSDFVRTPVVKNLHGDSSGVRGAAWLWPPPG
ncbi:MAG: ROK family protein [Acetobacteraceae bacterium]|nr:ROK family protein [Acetobacteraceae bacterium]